MSVFKAPTPAIARSEDSRDPLRGFKFKVIINNIEFGFHDVGPLSSEFDVTEYADGLSNGSVIKVPGIFRSDDVVLERGVLRGSDYLREWHNAIIDGGDVVDINMRFDVRVELQSSNRNDTNVIRIWTIKQAWPSRYELDNLNAESSDILMERITLANEGVFPVF